ncbi:hypothetical protein J4402_05005 [Candidatus Pacearchaeota archaeon]|nr:hypothetical protein [Candidatus Pacearchaeota archaeon]
MQKPKRFLTLATGALVTIASGCTATSIKDSTFYKDFAVQKQFGASHKSPQHFHETYKPPIQQKAPPCPEKIQCPPQTKHGLYTEPWTSKTPQSQITSTLSHSEPRKTSEQDIKFSLEKIVLHSQEYYVESNSQKREGELDFILKKEEPGTELRRSPYNQACGKIEIVSDKVYVPTSVKNCEGKKLVSAALKTEGKFGVSARTAKQNLEGVQVGVLYENNEDIRFNLKTAFINRQEYFVPVVDDSFYIIPLSTTQIGTEKSSGRIRLTNEKDGFFKLEEIPAKQYDARKVKTTKQQPNAGRLDSSTEVYSPARPSTQPSTQPATQPQ